MTLFPNQTARDVWRGHWCERCFQPDEAAKRLHDRGPGCPIIAKALERDRKPVEWVRNARAATMSVAYGCNAFMKRPAVNRRATTECVTESLFDDEPIHVTRNLVPVEGWPDYRAKGNGTDHA